MPRSGPWSSCAVLGAPTPRGRRGNGSASGSTGAVLHGEEGCLSRTAPVGPQGSEFGPIDPLLWLNVAKLRAGSEMKRIGRGREGGRERERETDGRTEG